MLPTKDEVRAKMLKSLDNLKDELKKVRTGRANMDMVSDIKVEAYDSTVPLNQVATINISDARSIMIQPWDKALLENVKKGFETSNSGLVPVIDGAIVRINIPALTEETRQEYVKLMKNLLEQCRIALRQVRHDAVHDYDKAKEDNEVTEDQVKKWRDDLDEMIAEMNKTVEEIGSAKEKEIMTV
jgi:ribosome recycling factor